MAKMPTPKSKPAPKAAPKPTRSADHLKAHQFGKGGTKPAASMAKVEKIDAKADRMLGESVPKDHDHLKGSKHFKGGM